MALTMFLIIFEISNISGFIFLINQNTLPFFFI